jgi:hypothetical protein
MLAQRRTAVYHHPGAAGEAPLIGVLSGGFTEGVLRQAGCVEIYPGPSALFARIASSLLAR